MARITVLLFFIVAIFGFSGCGSSEETTSLSVEERFQKAKELFDDENYLEAINAFSVITLQNQGSAYADDAQFYLGECHFRKGEYLLAAFEYGQLKRNMPASPLVPEGQYKLGLSYYMLSPKSYLDQQYTVRAIDELQSFVEDYRDNQYVPDAENKIGELTLRLAKKDFDTAHLYSIMGYYKAAILYYDGIIERYHDTEYAPLSYLGKAEALIARNRFQEALIVVSRFIQLYPESVLRGRADQLKETIIEEKLDSGGRLSGGESNKNQRSEQVFS